MGNVGNKRAETRCRSDANKPALEQGEKPDVAHDRRTDKSKTHRYSRSDNRNDDPQTVNIPPNQDVTRRKT